MFRRFPTLKKKKSSYSPPAYEANFTKYGRVEPQPELNGDVDSVNTEEDQASPGPRLRHVESFTEDEDSDVSLDGGCPYGSELGACAFFSTGYNTEDDEHDGCSVTGDVFGKQIYDFEDRLKNITYEGWIRVINDTTELFNILEIDDITKYLPLFQEELKLIQSKKPINRLNCFINIIRERPDIANSFWDALQTAKIAVDQFRKHINQLDEKYFQRRKVVESMSSIRVENKYVSTWDPSDTAKWRMIIETYRHRLRSFVEWITDILYKHEVISAKEKDELHRKRMQDEKENHFYHLMLDRNSKQRHKFLGSCLEDLVLTELQETLLSHPFVSFKRSEKSFHGYNTIPLIEDFIKRKSVDQMEEILEKWKDCDERCQLLIHGPNGVGKTAFLANAMTKVGKFGFTRVTWVELTGETGEDVTKEILKQLGGTFLNEDLHLSLDARVTSLIHEEEKMILVLDNLMDANVIKTLSRFQFIIVTSIKSDESVLDTRITKSNRFYIKMKKNFSVGECRCLLKKIIPHEHIADYLEPCMEICQDCNFHPPVITKIGNYIKDGVSDTKENTVRYLKTRFVDPEISTCEERISLAWKNAFDKLDDDLKFKYRYLIIFPGYIFPVSLTVIWNKDNNDVNNILRDWYRSGLIEDQSVKKAGIVQPRYSLNHTQRTLLKAEVNNDLLKISQSVVKCYRSRGFERIKESDEFFFTHIIDISVYAEDYSFAASLLSNAKYLIQRFKYKAVDRLLKDYFETHIRCSKTPEMFIELWYLSHLAIPKLSERLSLQMMKRIIVLQHHNYCIRRLLKIKDEDQPNPIHLNWQFEESPTRIIERWVPPVEKQKLRFGNAEIFTEDSHVTCMDIQTDTKLIIFGCNNGYIYLCSSRNFEILCNNHTYSYNFYVRFLRQSRCIVVSDSAIEFFEIEVEKKQYSLNSYKSFGISISGSAYSWDCTVSSRRITTPVDANQRKVWVMGYNGIQCLDIQKIMKDPNECGDIKYLESQELYESVENPCQFIAANQCEPYLRYAAATNGKNVCILKATSKSKAISVIACEKEVNCKIVTFINDKLIYSDNKTIVVCNWIADMKVQSRIDCGFCINFATPCNRCLVVGSLDHSVKSLDVYSKKLVDLPINKPAAVCVDDNAIYACDCDGNFVNIPHVANKCCHAIQFSLAQNLLDPRRFRSSLQRVRNSVHRLPVEREIVLHVEWIDKHQDYLATVVSRGNSFVKFRFILLRNRNEMLTHCEKTKANVILDMMKCCYFDDTVIAYGNKLLLEFRPFVQGKKVKVIDWNEESPCTVLTVCGQSPKLVAFAGSGIVRARDVHTESWQEIIDRRFLEKENCIYSTGLRHSNILLALLHKRDNYGECRVACINVSSPTEISYTRNVFRAVGFKVSHDERYFAVVEKHEHQVFVYEIMNSEHIQCINMECRVRSLYFHPGQSLKMYVSCINERLKQLELRIFDNGQMEKQMMLGSIGKSVLEPPESVTAIDCAMISNRRGLLLISDSKISLYNIEKGQYDVVFDISWIKNISSIQKCYSGDDGRYLCIVSSENKAFVLKSVRTITVTTGAQ